MQRDCGDGDGIISQIRSNRNEGKKRRKSRGEGNAKKLRWLPGCQIIIQEENIALYNT